jgi:hypothetical protein
LSRPELWQFKCHPMSMVNEHAASEDKFTLNGIAELHLVER